MDGKQAGKPLIDTRRLAELRDEIGAGDLGEVVAIFLDETDQVVTRLRAGHAADPAADLHFLKGSALNLGLAAFAAFCHQAEQRAAADGKELAALYQASKQALHKALSS
ncbi:Hpt domain-containing protein [Pseudogemmobacter humi]|uniref:Hpt domain protein n=1 Tax=Pseudogemmobacter humi TaxID=2483812 RepID=A0A3P5WRZ4_9RHOB|nr:Hpt domain-containing protein [Pseudogemmobacter humi]VDC21920.1 Hpt domain protein [Pseudogemmobacter humi]